MMEQNVLKNSLIEAYKNLSLDDQRNELNKEIIVMSSLINQLLTTHGESEFPTPYNYNSATDSKLSESEVLTQNYINIVNLKDSLLLLLSYMNK